MNTAFVDFFIQILRSHSKLHETIKNVLTLQNHSKRLGIEQDLYSPEKGLMPGILSVSDEK